MDPFSFSSLPTFSSNSATTTTSTAPLLSAVPSSSSSSSSSSSATIMPHPSPTSLFRDGTAPVFRACASAMQRPTLANVRIRSTRDAAHIFLAVAQNRLPMTVRRLDAEERRAIVSGNVYVWEERGANSEATGLGIERWTDGMRWSPSRVRDDFLFYHQKEMDADEAADLPPTRFARIVKPRAGSNADSPSSPSPAAAGPSSSSNINVANDGDDGAGKSNTNNSPTPARTPTRSSDPQRLIKQTYSVIVELPEDRARGVVRKWHLTAYFTQATVEQLSTVDRELHTADVVVPEGWFRSARTGKVRRDQRDHRDHQREREREARAAAAAVGVGSSSSSNVSGQQGVFGVQTASMPFGSNQPPAAGHGHVGAFALGAVHPGPQPYGRAQEWSERYVPVTVPSQAPYPTPVSAGVREGGMDVDMTDERREEGMDVDGGVSGGMDVDMDMDMDGQQPPPQPQQQVQGRYAFPPSSLPPPPSLSTQAQAPTPIAQSQSQPPAYAPTTARVPYASTTRERVAKAALRLNTGAVSIGGGFGASDPAEGGSSTSNSGNSNSGNAYNAQRTYIPVRGYEPLLRASPLSGQVLPPPPSMMGSYQSAMGIGAGAGGMPVFMGGGMRRSALGLGEERKVFSISTSTAAPSMTTAPMTMTASEPQQQQQQYERERSASPAVGLGLGLGLYSTPSAANSSNALNNLPFARVGQESRPHTPAMTTTTTGTTTYGPHAQNCVYYSHPPPQQGVSSTGTTAPTGTTGPTLPRTAPPSPERLLVPLDTLTTCCDQGVARRREPMDERVLRRFHGLRTTPPPGSPGREGIVAEC